MVLEGYHLFVHIADGCRRNGGRLSNLFLPPEKGLRCDDNVNEMMMLMSSPCIFCYMYIYILRY